MRKEEEVEGFQELRVRGTLVEGVLLKLYKWR